MNLSIREGFRKEKGLGSRDLGFRDKRKTRQRLGFFEKKTRQQLGLGFEVKINLRINLDLGSVSQNVKIHEREDNTL